MKKGRAPDSDPFHRLRSGDRGDAVFPVSITACPLHPRLTDAQLAALIQSELQKYDPVLAARYAAAGKDELFAILEDIVRGSKVMLSTRVGKLEDISKTAALTLLHPRRSAGDGKPRPRRSGWPAIPTWT